MTDNLSPIQNILDISTKAFEKGLNIAKVKTKDFSKAFAKDVAQAGKDALKFSSAITVGAVGAMTVLTKKSLEATDALAKFADKIGEDITVVRGFQKLAEESGMSVRSMNSALEKSARRLGDAAQGGGAAAKTIERLGLNVDELRQMRPSELMKTFGASINELGSREEKLAAISAVFGDEQRGLINIFDQGNDVFDTTIAKVEGVGAAISRVDAAKIEIANDAMADLQLISEGVGNSLASEVAPILSAVSKELFSAAAASGGFRDVVRDMVEKTMKGVAFMAQSIEGVELVWLSLKFAGQSAFLAILEGMTFVANGINNIIKKVQGAINQVKSFANSMLGFLDRVSGKDSGIRFDVVAPDGNQVIGDFVESMKASMKDSEQTNAFLGEANDRLNKAQTAQAVGNLASQFGGSFEGFGKSANKAAKGSGPSTSAGTN